MNVIIAGAGLISFNIAKKLLGLGHAVSIIDEDQQKLSHVSSYLDVKTIKGKSSYPSILEKAGAKDAKFIIAVHESDELNISICQIASALYNIPQKIARISTPDYICNKDLMEKSKELNIDIIISPEMAISEYFCELIEYDNVKILENLSYEISIIELNTSNSPELVGKSASSIKDICHELEGLFYISDYSGDRLVKDEDIIYIVIKRDNVRELLGKIGYNTSDHKSIIIVGAGHVGYNIADWLEKQNRYEVKIIEQNNDKAERVAEKLSKSMVISGNALEEYILKEAEIDKCDFLVCATNDDKVNMLVSLMARNFECYNSAVLMNEYEALAKMLSRLGIKYLIDPNEITSNYIYNLIRKKYEQFNKYKINETTSILEYNINSKSEFIGKSLAELLEGHKSEKHIIIGPNQANYNNDSYILSEGDTVILIQEL